jgi:hypothetical protein
MMNECAPDELDWVTERAKCSGPIVFKQLKALAKSDVKKREGVLTADERKRRALKFAVLEEEEVYFSVSGQETFGLRQRQQTVTFYLKDETIEISSPELPRSKFVATPMLTATGDCRLKVSNHLVAALNGAELTQWQVLRTALEDLFVPGPSIPGTAAKG